VLQPDLTGLHKARGKKHSKGGMEVLLKPDTFVFSDDPKLAFNKKDHELFEFKEGGSFASKKNTPAEVLKRQVDAKHYNSLINNINDVKKDATAKKSSQLMLEKYLEKLGNVAYLQEAKKGFPTGLPAFSQGTAPVYDANVKNEVEAEKQYARFGGAILPKAQMGGFPGFPGFEDKSAPGSDFLNELFRWRVGQGVPQKKAQVLSTPVTTALTAPQDTMRPIPGQGLIQPSDSRRSTTAAASNPLCTTRYEWPQHHQLGTLGR
jgi:hypothetical protein